MENALILAGGTIAEINIVEEYIPNSDIICVDSGADYALENKLEIKLALGDFDSINKNNYKILVDKKIPMNSFNIDKDFTDMELAIQYAVEKKYSKCFLFGASGTRLDHTIANVNLLIKYSKFFKQLLIIDNNNIIRLADSSIDESYIINRKKGYNLSILNANDNPVIKLEGVKWPLNNHQLKRDESLTISNEIISDQAKLTINGGSCFIFLSRD